MVKKNGESKVKRKYIRRKPSKLDAIKEIMLQTPHLRPDGVLVKLRARGISTTKGSFLTYRSNLRKQGHLLPFFGLGSSGASNYVKLGTKSARATKAIYNNPRKSPEQIRVILAGEGVKVSVTTINDIRARMKNVFWEIDFSKEPKPIRLTAEQKRLLENPKLNTWIDTILHVVIFPSKNWPKSLQIEFKQYVNGALPRIVAGYKPGKSSFKTYLNTKIKFLVRDFVREGLQHGLGLKQREVRLLIQIMREKSLIVVKAGAKGETNAEIAKKLKCSEKEVDELWKAYQEFNKMQRRLGIREER